MKKQKKENKKYFKFFFSQNESIEIYYDSISFLNNFTFQLQKKEGKKQKKTRSDKLNPPRIEI